jgi:hypothetical protein
MKIESARDLGPLFTNNSDRIIGLDGAFSIPLPDDRTLWFFGDTLIGARPTGSLWYINGKPAGPDDMSGRGTIDRMINNTGAIVRGRLGLDGAFDFLRDQRGQIKPLIPLDSDEHPDRDRIWCQHGIHHDGRLYLSFIKVRMLPVGSCPFPVCFEIVGSGLAVGDTDSWSFTRITRHGSSVLWKADEPHFATAFLRSGEFVYLYGTVNRSDGQQCFISRTRHIDAIQSYEYFTNGSWSPRLQDAQPIFGSMPSELSVSYNEHLQAFLAVHSLDLTGKIVARTAPNPWGPWSEPAVLWHVKVQHATPPPYPTLIYAGKEHPEMSHQNGRVIYLTYVEFEEYFPRLVEITLDPADHKR